jgi:hypothetical protein
MVKMFFSANALSLNHCARKMFKTLKLVKQFKTLRWQMTSTGSKG